MLMLKPWRNPFVLLVIFLCLPSACERKERVQVLGKDTIENILMVEDHSEVLLEWLQKGYQEKIVVFVDRHDDLRNVPEQKIEQLTKLYKKEKWEEIAANRDRGTEGLFTLGDFLYPAYRLGVIKKLYWVNNSPFLLEKELESAGKQMLKGLNYPDAVINTFKRKYNSIRGSIYGLDVTISTLENLPIIEEPVLLSIDIDVFERDLPRMSYSGLMVLQDYWRKLRNKRMKVQHLSIAYSNRGNYTGMSQRHMGDELELIFTHPEIPTQGFPEMWITRDRAFALLRQGGYAQAALAFAVAREAYPDEHSFKLGSAIAFAMMGKDDKALSTLEELVYLSPESDYAYISIGNMLGSKDQKARYYYSEYLRRHPGSYHGFLAYGNFFYERGRYKEALNLYRSALVQFLDVNTIIACGDALMQLGEYKDAGMYYMKGLQLLPTVGYRSVKQYPQLMKYMRRLAENRGNKQYR